MSRHESATAKPDTSPRLSEMGRIGVVMVSRYRGLVATVWAVQLLVSGVAGWLISTTLMEQAARTRALERAVADDLTAMLMIASNAPHTTVFAFWSIASVSVLYALLTWFLAGGIISVLLQRPYRRSDVVETFGAGGAHAWLRFLCLAAVALPLHLGAVSIAGAGAFLCARALGDAVLLDATAAFGTLVGAVPGACLLLAVTTAVDFARIDLIRHPQLGVVRAFLRALRLTITRLRPIGHSAIYWGLFALVTLIYAWAGPTGGAMTTVPFIALVVARLSVTALRQSARIAVIAGQIEYAQLSVFPPARSAKPATPSAAATERSDSSADVIEKPEDERDR